MLKENAELVLRRAGFGDVAHDREQPAGLAAFLRHRGDHDIPPFRDAGHRGAEALKAGGLSAARLRGGDARGLAGVVSPESAPRRARKGGKALDAHDLPAFRIHGDELEVGVEHHHAVAGIFHQADVQILGILPRALEVPAGRTIGEHKAQHDPQQRELHHSAPGHHRQRHAKLFGTEHHLRVMRQPFARIPDRAAVRPDEDQQRQGEPGEDLRLRRELHQCKNENPSEATPAPSRRGQRLTRIRTDGLCPADSPGRVANEWITNLSKWGTFGRRSAFRLDWLRSAGPAKPVYLTKALR